MERMRDKNCGLLFVGRYSAHAKRESEGKFIQLGLNIMTGAGSKFDHFEEAMHKNPRMQANYHNFVGISMSVFYFSKGSLFQL